MSIVDDLARAYHDAIRARIAAEETAADATLAMDDAKEAERVAKSNLLRAACGRPAMAWTGSDMPTSEGVTQ